MKTLEIVLVYKELSNSDSELEKNSLTKDLHKNKISHRMNPILYTNFQIFIKKSKGYDLCLK